MKKKMKPTHLQEEPQDRQDPGDAVGQPEGRTRGTTEEEGHHDRGHGDHRHELGQHEHPEPHARVLGVEAADQFPLGLGEVEGRATGFGHHPDHEDEEGREQRDRVPARDAVDEARPRLTGHDVGDPQRLPV
jgi:hypothetical protein